MQKRTDNKQHKIFYGSSYDRGLDVLLFMWPDIIEKYPDAELHVCYGWDMFDKVTATNPERQQWKQQVVDMMSQKGVIHHGRIGGDKLRSVRETCGIWAYPTYFPEIHCITALEVQRDGLVPVTMNDFALKETAPEGILIDGKIDNKEVQEKFKNELMLLMGDQKRWEVLSGKVREFAKDFTWENTGSKWLDEIREPVSEPLVSVITLTIRTGWWNIMANNLSKQSYKNFEWIIIDDYEEDRSEIAKKYAKKYNLNIRYIRGDKVLKKYDRRYGLVRANNIGWQKAKGELLVYLQDFILIPGDGIESLVDIYRHNPNSLIAPVDQYWFTKEPDRSNKEDWWNGDLDMAGDFSWRNVRVKFKGISKTDNPFDFEMNYGAVPKHIAESLNGWWEFFDDALGYDNTEFANRALNAGYSILIDDANIAMCFNLWPILKGEKENIEGRSRTLALPQWVWLKREMANGNMPIIRDADIDKKLKKVCVVPDEVKDEDVTNWLVDHATEIIAEWDKK